MHDFHSNHVLFFPFLPNEFYLSCDFNPDHGQNIKILIIIHDTIYKIIGWVDTKVTYG
jgi:hypothetical protein